MLSVGRGRRMAPTLPGEGNYQVHPLAQAA